MPRRLGKDTISLQSIIKNTLKRNFKNTEELLSCIENENPKLIKNLGDRWKTTIKSQITKMEKRDKIVKDDNLLPPPLIPQDLSKSPSKLKPENSIVNESNYKINNLTIKVSMTMNNNKEIYQITLKDENNVAIHPILNVIFDKQKKFPTETLVNYSSPNNNFNTIQVQKNMMTSPYLNNNPWLGRNNNNIATNVTRSLFQPPIINPSQNTISTTNHCLQNNSMANMVPIENNSSLNTNMIVRNDSPLLNLTPNNPDHSVVMVDNSNKNSTYSSPSSSAEIFDGQSNTNNNQYSSQQQTGLYINNNN